MNFVFCRSDAVPCDGIEKAPGAPVPTGYDAIRSSTAAATGIITVHSFVDSQFSASGRFYSRHDHRYATTPPPGRGTVLYCSSYTSVVTDIVCLSLADYYPIKETVVVRTLETERESWGI